MLGLLVRSESSCVRALTTTRSLQSAGADQQQPAVQAGPDHSVLDTMKLLEAGIGPLSQQPMVSVAKTPSMYGNIKLAMLSIPNA